MTDKCFEIGIVDNLDDFLAVMQLRREVFVNEEHVSPEKEFDKNDLAGAVHFYMKDDEKVIGTLRARLFPDFVKLERLCLKKDYRKSSAAKQLIDFTFDYCAHKGYKKACGLCTEHLLPYWDKLGLKHNPNIAPIKVSNMTLYTVTKDIPPSPQRAEIEKPESLLQSEGETARRHYVNNRLSVIMASLAKKQNA